MIIETGDKSDIKSPHTLHAAKKTYFEVFPLRYIQQLSRLLNHSTFEFEFFPLLLYLTGKKNNKTIVLFFIHTHVCVYMSICQNIILGNFI